MWEKCSESKLFGEYVEEPRAFAVELAGEQIGWIEVGYQKWNNRMRVWEFLVREEFRRKGIGTLLMNHAVELAKEKRARMLVLETQSCDVPAIGFYLRFGFELIGFDAAAYSNEDIAKKEVRLEFGLKIT
jgi:ribosomal protein S18 acetylase RimI-like enzyme